MVEWKRDRFDCFMRAVQEVVNCESVCLVYIGWTRYRMKHWTNDNIWVDHRQVKGPLVVFYEFPCSLLRQLLRRVLPEHCVLLSNCVFCCDLPGISAFRYCKIKFRRKLTGFQSASV